MIANAEPPKVASLPAKVMTVLSGLVSAAYQPYRAW